MNELSISETSLKIKRENRRRASLARQSHDNNANDKSMDFDGVEIDNPENKDVNLFISHLEISKGDLGLDNSGFMDGIFKDNYIINSVERLNTSYNKGDGDETPRMREINEERNKLIPVNPSTFADSLREFLKQYSLEIGIAFVVLVVLLIIVLVFLLVK